MFSRIFETSRKPILDNPKLLSSLMESAFTFFHIISIIATFLSLSMGSFLLLIKSKSNVSNKYLGLLILSYSLFFIPGFIDSIGLLYEIPYFIRLNFYCGSLVGPLTYLYCKSSIHKENLHWKNILPHFVLFVILLIYYFPILLKSAEKKVSIYQTTISTGQVPESKFVITGLGFLTLGYTIVSIKLVLGYMAHIKNTHSSIDTSFHKWLLFLCLSLIAPIFATLLITISSNVVMSIPMGLFTIASFIFIIYIVLNMRPKFFHDFPHQIEDLKEEKIKKYKGSNLQDYQKDIYQSKLIDYMKKDKPYLNPEMTINQFSDQVKIPSYYVSQIINEKLNCNFLDFVNQYRIEEAKTKLLDKSKNHFTIMAIAHESGFNSKTAFYSAFKKNVGGTPNQYRKKDT